MDQPETPPQSTNWLLASLAARRGVLTALAILAGLGLLAKAAWNHFGPAIAESPRYRVTPATVAITPPPAWVRDDPVAAAFTAEPLADGLSILDPPEQFDEPLSAALASHPWVRRVASIEKAPPNRVSLEVEYRTPIAAVMVGDHLTPTDVDGVRLPARDISRAYLRRLPRIGVASGVATEPAPAALAADAWPDDAIAGAAEIVAAFGSAFQELRLIEVQIDPLPDVRAGMRFASYRLRSSGNTLVLWGAAPGYGPSDEASFETKLGRLRESVARYGPLDSVETSPALVDVRNGVDAFRRVVMKDGKRVALKEADEVVK